MPRPLLVPFLAALPILGASSLPTAEILYVDDDASAAGDGSSWARAFRHLQDALAIAAAGDEVRVAQGLYLPDRGIGYAQGDRHASFLLPSGLTLNGGYRGSGGGGSPNDRDPDAFPSVLSGDLAQNDGSAFENYAENSLDVVQTSSGFETVQLEGLVIAHGNDDGAISPPGAGLSAIDTDLLVRRCTFLACDRLGAFLRDGHAVFEDCRFLQNRSLGPGGAVLAIDMAVSFVNCILWANTDSGPPDKSAQIDSEVEPPIVDYCCIQGWTGGGNGNIAADPSFVDELGYDEAPATGDENWKLAPGSPCIDAGENVAMPPDEFDLDGDGDTLEPLPFDLSGSARFVDDPDTDDTGDGWAPIVDMGALEAQLCAVTVYCQAAPNSAGDGARMSAVGSTSISANRFALSVVGAPPGQVGLFCYGPERTQVPFGNGFLCLDAGSSDVFRLYPPAPVSASGTIDRWVNFEERPAGDGPGRILPGSCWNFQLWYRDPAAGGAGHNLSDALSATFCP